MKKLSLLLATLLVCGAICVGCAPEDPFAGMGSSSSSSTATSSSSQTAGDSSQVGQDSSSSSQQQTTTVTFDTIYGTVSTPNAVITAGETYSLPTPIEPAGPKLYKFEGWAYNGNIIPQTGIWDIQASSVLLTAVWKINFTAVSFNANNYGTAPSTVEKLIYGETYTLPEPTLPDGPELYKFEGWSYNGNIISQTGTWDIQESGIELIAVWKCNHTTVTFNTKNWGTVNPITVTFILGESYQLPTELILSEAEKQQDEYTFMGWTYNGMPMENSGTWTIQEESVELVAILHRNYTNWH